MLCKNNYYLNINFYLISYLIKYFIKATISSWPERVTNHNGYEKTQTSLEGSSGEFFAMSASLTESFSVKEDSKLNYCKLQLFL